MAKTFAYKARDRAGRLVAGTIVAENEAAVAASIRAKGYYVARIKEQRLLLNLKTLALVSRVSSKDLAVFCRQFATMLDAGLAMAACLSILVDQTANRRLQTAIQEIQHKVQAGESLHQAMADQPRVFPAVMASMVAAGELGGALDNVLDRLALQFEQEYKLSEKIKSAMSYPAVVLGMAVLTVIFMLIFVLPTFITLFAAMRVSLPLPTRVLLAVSRFLHENWWLLCSGLTVIVISFNYGSRQPCGQKILDQGLLRMPIIGGLRRKVAIARFSRLLSTLIAGGVPLISALEVVKGTTGSPTVAQALTTAQSSVCGGLGLAAPLSMSGIFNPMVIQLVAIGEETGALDKMLAKIADFYESEIDDAVTRLSSMIEPVLIGVVGVIIGLMVIAIILPIFDAIANFNQAI